MPRNRPTAPDDEEQYDDNSWPAQFDNLTIDPSLMVNHYNYSQGQNQEQDHSAYSGLPAATSGPSY